MIYRLIKNEDYGHKNLANALLVHINIPSNLIPETVLARWLVG